MDSAQLAALTEQYLASGGKIDVQAIARPAPQAEKPLSDRDEKALQILRKCAAAGLSKIQAMSEARIGHTKLQRLCREHGLVFPKAKHATGYTRNDPQADALLADRLKHLARNGYTRSQAFLAIGCSWVRIKRVEAEYRINFPNRNTTR